MNVQSDLEVLGFSEEVRMSLQIGDRVKWTGKAGVGQKEHTGRIHHFMEKGGKIVNACVHEDERINKRTGAKLAQRTYMPYVSQLTKI